MNTLKNAAQVYWDLILWKRVLEQLVRMHYWEPVFCHCLADWIIRAPVFIVSKYISLSTFGIIIFRKWILMQELSLDKIVMSYNTVERYMDLDHQKNQKAFAAGSSASHFYVVSCRFSFLYILLLFSLRKSHTHHPKTDGMTILPIRILNGIFLYSLWDDYMSIYFFFLK